MSRYSRVLPLRLAVPLIAFAAVMMTGEPVNRPLPLPEEKHSLTISTPATDLASEPPLVKDEASAERRRTAMRLRWAITLPDTSRPWKGSISY